MVEKHSVVCDTGECINIIYPGTGCKDVIGIGHPGKMRYYRVISTSKDELKINRTCISFCDPFNPAYALYHWFQITSDRHLAQTIAKQVMSNVKQTRNPFSGLFLADNPEFQ